MATTTENVQIVVSAKDEASKTMSGIGHSISTAIGTFAGGAALNIATKGFDALWGAVKGGIGDARDAAQVFAQTQAVIKSTGGAAGFTAEQIAEMAGSLSAASGKSLFGDDDIQRGQNMLLTFTNITTQLPNATQAMLDMAQATGTDAGGAAVQLGKALNDPIQGISALSRVGVSFTEQQKAQIATMQEAGDMAGAQAIILAELNKEFGGSAAAAAAADGGMAQFNDRMGELAESIGAQLLPVLNEMLAWLNSPDIQAAIVMIATNLVDAVKGAIGAFKDFLTAISPVVEFVKANMTPILAGLAAMLITVVVPAFLAWSATAATAATATIVALAPVLIPIAAIGAAVAVLTKAWTDDWGGMRTTLTAWWNGTVQPILKTVQQWLQDHLPAANAALKAAWETAWSAIKSAISTAWSFMQTSVFPALKTAIDGVGTVIGTLQSAWSTAWSAISGAASSAKNVISGVISSITGFIDAAIKKINNLISAINSIPAVPNIPTIPTGSGSSGFGGPRALGGPVLSGMSYLVGEQGPELFVPRSSGTIVPGATYSITVDARGASDPAAVERAGYLGAKRAMQETGNLLTELRSGGRF